MHLTVYDFINMPPHMDMMEWAGSCFWCWHKSSCGRNRPLFGSVLLGFALYGGKTGRFFAPDPKICRAPSL